MCDATEVEAGTRAGLRGDGGYILVPIIVMLTMILAAVYAATLQGSVGMESTARAREARQALLVAQSGIEHAIHVANSASCTDYALPTTAFGAHSYSATFTPDSNSPVTITSTATLASGLTRSITRENTPIYESSSGTLFLQPGEEGKDTAINSSKPAANHGTDPVLEIEEPGVENALLQFDLSGIPPNARVESATLELFVVGGFVTTIEIFRLTRDWVEGTCVGSGPPCPADGATWDHFDGTSAWTTTGGDFDPAVVARADTEFLNQWLEFDVSALASLWHEGVPNHGMLLRTIAGWVEFTSSDYANATLHPKLTIEYSCECDPNPNGGTAVLQPGPGFGKDVTIRGGFDANENFGTENTVFLNEVADIRTLIQFDLSNLPQNAIVSDARLEFYFDVLSTLPHYPVSVHRMTTPWTEGSGGSSGLTPADGATWNTSDGVTPWTYFGGDFDTNAIDSTPILGLVPQWYEWDVTSAVSDWKQGIHPNYGLLLGGGWGVLSGTRFVSSDRTTATYRPKLTVTYFCPCGADCNPPVSVGGNLLMVVVDPSSLTTQEVTKQALIESWGFTVSLIDEAATQAEYDVALSQNDVVFVTEDALSTEIQHKLSASPIGVVSEEANLSDELGTAESVTWISGIDLEILDTSHYITAPFALGDLTIVNASTALAYQSGVLSPDLTVLADTTSGSGEPLLVALEQGAERWDQLASLDARRVQLPWGGDDFQVSNLTDDGLTLFQRALEWAATTPSPPSGYLDRFAAPICDASIDLAGSYGALDWSGTPWLDDEDGSFCNGDAEIQLVDHSYRLMLTGDALTVSRPADLAGFSYGLLRLRYKTLGAVDASHFVAVETSSDGGTNWVEIGRLDDISPASDSIVSFPITTPLTADSMIRFRTDNLGAGRSVWIDDVTLLDEELEAGFVCGVNYLDSVTGANYTGDNGTLSWTTDWLEVNESDGPTSGDSRAIELDGGFVLHVSDNNNGGEGIQREADLSATTTATLNFRYRRIQFDNNSDYVTIAASSDGGSNWSALGTIGGGGTDDEWISASYSLDAYLAANSRILFFTSPNLGDNDFLYLDDVEICLEADPASAP